MPFAMEMTDFIETTIPMKPGFLLEYIIFWPFKDLAPSSILAVRTSAVSDIFIEDFLKGALKPDTLGDREFTISKAILTALIKKTVPSQHAKSGFLRSSLRKSRASATEELSVCAASFTFIFCMCHWMWLEFNLFAKCIAKQFQHITDIKYHVHQITTCWMREG